MNQLLLCRGYRKISSTAGAREAHQHTRASSRDYRLISRHVPSSLPGASSSSERAPRGRCCRTSCHSQLTPNARRGTAVTLVCCRKISAATQQPVHRVVLKRPVSFPANTVDSSGMRTPCRLQCSAWTTHRCRPAAFAGKYHRGR
jgi:hypothetical protein